jgi:hypothetical protein
VWSRGASAQAPNGAAARAADMTLSTVFRKEPIPFTLGH